MKDVCTGAYCVVPVVQTKGSAHALGLPVWPPFVKSEMLKLDRRRKTILSNLHFTCHKAQELNEIYTLQYCFEL